MHLDRMKKWSAALANYHGRFYMGSFGNFDKDGNLICGCAATVASLVFDDLHVVGFKYGGYCGITMAYNGHMDYQAIAHFFDISEFAAERVCNPDYYRGPTSMITKEMAKARIDELITAEEAKFSELIHSWFKVSDPQPQLELETV